MKTIFAGVIALALTLTFSVPVVLAEPQIKVSSGVWVATSTPPKPPTVRELILKYSTQYDFPVDLALSIAQCESELNPKARNKLSTAKGVYQFLNGSWRGYSLEKWGTVKDVLNPAHNVELGLYVLSKYGTKPWVSSRGCWG